MWVMNLVIGMLNIGDNQWIVKYDIEYIQI